METLLGSEPPRSPYSDDERLALVRFDIADTARIYGMRLVAKAVETASTRDAWLTIEADIESMRTHLGSDGRWELTRVADAAELLADGSLDLAVKRLAKHFDSIDAWLDDVRADRAKAGAL